MSLTTLASLRGDTAFTQTAPRISEHMIITRIRQWRYTYDILPNGPNAALTSSVVISGLRSPTNTWKWSRGRRDTTMTKHMKQATIRETLTPPPPYMRFLLLVSFFWLVGVVAQLTFTSWIEWGESKADGVCLYDSGDTCYILECEVVEKWAREHCDMLRKLVYKLEKHC